MHKRRRARWKSKAAPKLHWLWRHDKVLPILCHHPKLTSGSWRCNQDIQAEAALGKLGPLSSGIVLVFNSNELPKLPQNGKNILLETKSVKSIGFRESREHTAPSMGAGLKKATNHIIRI